MWSLSAEPNQDIVREYIESIQSIKFSSNVTQDHELNMFML